MENNRKIALEIFIEFKINSNIDSRIKRLENEKLKKIKRGLFKYNFQGEFSLKKVYLKNCNLICAKKKPWRSFVKVP